MEPEEENNGSHGMTPGRDHDGWDVDGRQQNTKWGTEVTPTFNKRQLHVMYDGQ